MVRSWPTFLLILAVTALVGAAGMRSAVAPSPAIAQPANGPVCRTPELTTSFGRWFSPSVVLTPNVPSAVAPNDGLDVGGQRLFLRLDKAGSGKWKIAIRAADNRLLSLIDASDFPLSDQNGKTGLWTGRLDGAQLYVEIVSKDRSVQVVVEKGIALRVKAPVDARLFSLQSNTPRWEELYSVNDATIRSLGAVVGMMHSGGVSRVQIDAGTYAPQSWCCSGVMISPDLYMTNYHCGSPDAVSDDAWGQDQCDITVIDLGWEEKGVRRQFACRKVIAKSRRLDYAILRVTPVAGTEGGRGGSLAAVVALSPAMPNDRVFVIHHASCEFKRVSRKCYLRDRRRAWTDPGLATDKPEYGYDCDTEPGASGGPVFNERGQLVALHHLGFKQCGGGDKLNAAVGMTAIIDDVRRDNPGLAKELGW